MSNPLKWDIQSGSTWKPTTDLSKAEIVRLYDALAQAKNREEIMRSMIHYSPEHETVFANLIRRVHRTFEDNACPSANYKTKCYKELKHVLNEFQGNLFTDSGESVRFTTRVPSPNTLPSSNTLPSPKTVPSPKTLRSRSPKTLLFSQRDQIHDPAPLQPSISNYILHMPHWKIKRFAEMILERNTDEERTNFIKKYVHATDDDGEPFPGLLRDIIVDILHISNCDETTKSKINNIFVHLLHLKNTTYPEVIHILYPFPAMYSNVRNLGKRGGIRRRRRTVRK